MSRRSDSRTFIVPFSVRIEPNRRYRDATEAPILSNFNGEGGDLLFELDAFVRGLPQDQFVQRDEQHFGQPTELDRHGRVIRWTMQAGQSGKVRDIILRKGETPQKRHRDGIEWSAYRVYAVIPTNSLTGWIFVEKEGTDSLPTEWRTEFISLFRQRHPRYLLRMAQLRSTSLWREVENALDEQRVLQVEVAQRAGTSNPLAPTMRGFPREAVASTTTLYEPQGGGRANGRFLRIVRRAFTDTKNSQGIVEMDLDDPRDDLSGDFDVRLKHDVIEITARVRLADGRRKTIRFSGVHEPFESYMIEGLDTERVTSDRFAAECKEHVLDLAREGGVTLDQGWDTGAWEPKDLLPPMEVNSSEDADQPRAPVVDISDVRTGA